MPTRGRGGSPPLRVEANDGAIERPHRRADGEIRCEASFGERLEHADLDRAETAAAAENEGPACSQSTDSSAQLPAARFLPSG